ncbi:AI-2E family transporter [uncultured Rubinisphaera sp.]|uniref:AI-2E family transporter n=1 Tax=uncultured Rubinisphaera sp. TaxID=1678686 RepID=UPI0030DA8AE2
MQEAIPHPDDRRSPFINSLMIAAAVVIVIAGISSARAIIIPFLLAIFIGVIISAILEWLKKRDINTGAAIFLLMVFMGVSSLIATSVVVSSVNELAGRLPELNAVVINQEQRIVKWLEDRGFSLDLPKEESTSSKPQSVEISVPGLMPVPEASTSDSIRSGADVTTLSPNAESPLPEVGTSETSSETLGSQNPAPPVLQPETTTSPADTSSEVTPPEDSADGNAEDSTETEMPEMEQPAELVAPQEAEVVVEETPLVKPFGLPGYIFGEQRHIIEFSPMNPANRTANRDEGVLNIFSPVQIFRTFLESVVGILNYTLIVLLMLFFLLLEWSRFGKKLEELPGNSQKYIEQVSEVLASIRRYMLIKTMVSLLTGLLITAALILLNTDYAALWGIVAFLFNYIPTIGSMVAGIVPVLYVLVDQGPWAAAYVAIVFLVVNFVIGNLLEPRIMGEGLGLSTFVVFLSLIFWGWVLGPAGMLLAVPLTMVVKITLASDERTRWFALLLGSKTEMASVSKIME